MLRYEPGSSVGHALDPRTKLAIQAGFAVAAFAHTTPRGLAVLTVVALAIVGAARLSPLSTLSDVRVALPILLVAPLLEGLTLGSPWFSIAEARFPALASYRVLLILFVSAAYVHTTPTRESRAAVQWLVPGKPGQFLGMGVAFVFRFLPVLIDDLVRAREALHARLGTERPLTDRMQLVATAGLRRAFARSDAFSLALQARCFAWNPTLPRLTLGRRDAPGLVLALGLAVSALL
ncbi:energy-coupling factor transporter transmembrane component T family protein [Halorientalis brevis]|uniref:Energy-coupling factor transporter transmembrane component T family protein n=1 Tax=Halorientalis brevis TaxID=1126241 RepID=A0ABD6CA83_9EURY|nr:energy-coupling factor transporter transmembrane component T [Halorientalis brevis]